MATQTTAALARVEEVTAKPLSKIEDARAALLAVRDQVHMLCPVTQLDYIPPHHQVSLRTVMLDPKRDCYTSSFTKNGTVAPKKEGILRILSAAGADVRTVRVDDRSNPYYWEVEATVTVKEFDGTISSYQSRKGLNLNDGTPDAVAALGTSNNKQNLVQARQHGLSMCETKAILRAARGKFQIAQTYSPEELKKPFLFPKLVPAPDMDDPQVKAAYLQSTFGAPAERQLFGGTVHDLPADSVRQLPSGDSNAPAATTSTPAIRTVVVADDEDEAVDTGDFEVLEDPRKGEDVIVVCGCPCGDQVQLVGDTPTLTMDRLGALRCVQCVPGKKFDNARHRELGDLKLPKLGAMTGEEACRRADAARAAAK